jgi:glycosyltransferase involved in cell wall biosynthesis
MATPFRVVLWGTYDQHLARIRLLEAGLRAQGCEVRVCHRSVWLAAGDKWAGLGWRTAVQLLRRLLWAYVVLLWRYVRLPPHDVVLVSHPGLLDALVIAPWARLRGARVAWDVYVSPYDTLVLDRAILKPKNPLARLLWCVEKLAWSLVEHPFADTAAHARRLEELFRLTPGRCGHVWVGAEAPFETVQLPKPRAAKDPLEILFYSTFLPLHGAEVVLEAARLLAPLPIHWTLIGTGPEAQRLQLELARHPLPRVRWLPPVSYARLPEHLQAVDVVLGVFGTTDKAASVIPNKVYQAVAAGRPIITRAGSGAQEWLAHRPPWVYLVPPGDAAALAAAVSDFYARSLPPSPEHPHHHLLASLVPEALARQLLEVLQAPRQSGARP